MDCELVARARDGDREAFALIADAIFDRCFEIARRIIGESPLAQDATQQALLSIWRDLPKLRDVAKFDAWSRRILVNACYAEIARAKRTLPGPSIVPMAGPIAPDEFASVVDRDELGRAFAHQKVEHRAVLVLRYYLDLPVEEVALTLDIPLGTAKSRIHHGLKAMRASLEAARRPTSGGTAGVTPGAINDFSRPARQVTS